MPLFLTPIIYTHFSFTEVNWWRRKSHQKARGLWEGVLSSGGTVCCAWEVNNGKSFTQMWFGFYCSSSYISLDTRGRYDGCCYVYIVYMYRCLSVCIYVGMVPLKEVSLYRMLFTRICIYTSIAWLFYVFGNLYVWYLLHRHISST